MVVAKGVREGEKKILLFDGDRVSVLQDEKSSRKG